MNADDEVKLMEIEVQEQRKKLERMESSLHRKKMSSHLNAWKTMVSKCYLVHEDWSVPEGHYRKVLSVTGDTTSITVHYTDLKMHFDTYTLKKGKEWFVDASKLEDLPFKFEKEISESDFNGALKSYLLRSNVISPDSLGEEFFKFSPYYLDLKKIADAVKQRGDYRFTEIEFNGLELLEESKKRLIAGNVIYLDEGSRVWIVRLRAFSNAWNKFY